MSVFVLWKGEAFERVEVMDKENTVTHYAAQVFEVVNIDAVVCFTCVGRDPDGLGFFKLLQGAGNVK